jgi:hypothetical protein
MIKKAELKKKILDMGPFIFIKMGLPFSMMRDARRAYL